jgi:hypothetical protein
MNDLGSFVILIIIVIVLFFLFAYLSEDSDVAQANKQGALVEKFNRSRY